MAQHSINQFLIELGSGSSFKVGRKPYIEFIFVVSSKPDGGLTVINSFLIQVSSHYGPI